MSEVSQLPSDTGGDGDIFVLPMSFGQEQLWIINEMAPGNTAYNVLAPLRIRGRLDVTALERALNEIVRRHEALRTTFDVDDTGPVQVIAKAAKIPFILVNLSGVPESTREAELLDRLSEAGTLPFDLKHGPLCRAHLFQLSADHHVLLWNMHHIISDGWSYSILTEEMGAILAAFARGEPCPLAELTIQYADFSQWQRQHFTQERLAGETHWWKQQLEGAPDVIELPTDRTPRPTPSYAGRTRIHHFKPELIERLQSLSRTLDVTLFTTTFAAFFVLMHRYAGQSDLVVGTPTANRPQAELEQLIGYFVNTLPIRVQLEETMTMRSLIARLSSVLYGAYEHQELPFEKLVAALQPNRARNRHPVFQVTFQCHKAFIRLPRVPGLEFSHIHIDRQGAPVDLNFAMIERDGRWRISAEYSTEIFDEATIDRMLGHYQVLLEGIVSNADQRLADLPLLTLRERQQLLVEWNSTDMAYPRDRCIHELFEAQADQTPDAVAAVFLDQKLTYRELNHRSNQLAHQLQRLGVKPNTFVAICVDRSLHMLTGLLGILKAGGAYVPLDPALPGERLSYLIQDAEPVLLLTQSDLVESLPRHVNVLCLDTDWQTISEHSTGNPRSQASPEDRAYLAYTSGSTGQPKGVEIIHRGVVRLVKGTGYASFSAPEVFLQLAPLAFDASTFEIWGPLLNGARLVVMPPHQPTLEEIGQAILKHGVTTLWLTAGLFHLMVDERLDDLKPLRQVIAGGDVLSVLRVQQACRELPQCRLINGYGPTENTTFTCCYEIDPQAARGQSVPIGRPISNTRIFILDRQLKPVPVGVPGEIHIGGDGLARGYLNRPELTAERFIPHPFSDVPGDRLYKTGDRARYLADSNIEFLGRLDEQVKVRGFRVEPGEIEAAILEHKGVRECAVLARHDLRKEKQLVAFVVPRDSSEVAAAELGPYLKMKLPDYMVPSVFIMMASLPLTPNGKLNRKALPETVPAIGGAKPGHVAPRTPIEQALAGIWQEVLGVSQVGIHDNFFDLGGHSLLAARLQVRVEKQLAKRLPLVAFFQSPTVAELSELLENPGMAASHVCLLTPQSRTGGSPLFCLHFLDSARRLALHLGPKRPVYGLESPIDAELRRWHEHRQLDISVEELAERCLAVIRKVQPEGPYCLMGFCFGGTLAFEIASHLTLRGERVAFLGLVDAFYLPGCQRLSMSWLRRWKYHSGRVAVEGLDYLSRKISERRALAKRRRSQLELMRVKELPRDETKTERMHLPQAEFLGQITRHYRGKPYAGRAALLRAAGEPSFTFDVGAANGWEAVIHGELRVEEMPCGHMEIAEEPHVAQVARWLDRHLDQADARTEA